jgi:hypothetical protein
MLEAVATGQDSDLEIGAKTLQNRSTSPLVTARDEALFSCYGEGSPLRRFDGKLYHQTETDALDVKSDAHVGFLLS